MTHQTNEELREKIKELFNDHYWDSLSKDRDLILGHCYFIVDEIMSLIPQPEQLKEVFNCPACPNQGWYTDGELNQNTGECEAVQVQCEFCYTHPQSVFNYMAKVKVSNFIVTNEPEGELK